MLKSNQSRIHSIRHWLHGTDLPHGKSTRPKTWPRWKTFQLQIRGYKKSDPPEQQQVALTGSIIRESNSLALTKLDKAMSELFTGAFFFAMRSCEYLKVPGKWRTKLLSLKNIRFFKGRREINHSDEKLSKAGSVSITFELQKRGTKFDTPSVDGRYNSKHFHGRKQKTSPNHRKSTIETTAPSCSSTRSQDIGVQTGTNRITFRKERSSNGYVPCWRPGVHYHAPGPLVKWCIPAIHEETSDGIQCRYQHKDESIRRFLYNTHHWPYKLKQTPPQPRTSLYQIWPATQGSSETFT